MTDHPERRSAATSAVDRAWAAAQQFAWLRDLDRQRSGRELSECYWKAKEVSQFTTPFIDRRRIEVATYAFGVQAQRTLSSGEEPQTDNVEPELHVLYCAHLTAMYVEKFVAEVVPWPSDQCGRVELVVRYAKATGIGLDGLRSTDRRWRYFSALRRMPTDETILLAFDAAWEARAYQAAVDLARRGWSNEEAADEDGCHSGVLKAAPS